MEKVVNAEKMLGIMEDMSKLLEKYRYMYEMSKDPQPDLFYTKLYEENQKLCGEFDTLLNIV